MKSHPLAPILVFLVFLWVSSSCQTPAGRLKQDVKDFKVIDGFNGDYFYVINVMDCSYIVYHGGQKGGIVHAANCQNHGAKNIPGTIWIEPSDAGPYTPTKKDSVEWGLKDPEFVASYTNIGPSPVMWVDLKRGAMYKFTWGDSTYYVVQSKHKPK